MQQPVQFVASHFAAPQVRLVASQTRPDPAQLTHWLPAVPQADGSVPLRQSVRPLLSTEQHPLGHVAPLHVGSMRPHTCVDVHMLKPVPMQSVQLSPTEPHARMSLPV